MIATFGDKIPKKKLNDAATDYGCNIIKFIE